PFARAVLALASAGRLTAAPIGAALAALLPRVPDTGIQRLLRTLGGALIAAAQTEVIVAAAVAAVRTLPMERLGAVCLLDRWLKLWAPAARDELVGEARGRAERALADRTLASVDDAELLRLPAAAIARLGAQAAAAGLGAAWQERQTRFADRVLDVLEAAPKSLSQANAEELLARRIYTAPGHLFFELLQNADDSGASSWRVDLDDGAITVWHDGQLFDAKDVAGVLAIGQTTKQRDQIGLFGVGFKSVYEVCERPQIHSGAFHFEIADISIPRRLAPAGDGAGTRLVLPLRDPTDPRRSPAELFRLARALPPQVLLTLRSVRTLRVAHGADAATAVATAAGPGETTIRAVETGATERYAWAAAALPWSGLPSGDGRPAGAPVLVAVLLDDAGAPRPLPPGAATVYSYLPTAERSGLRFLVHAHFQVPLDRERLDHAAPYNARALETAGDLLAGIAARLAAAAPPRARGLLDVLPLEGELGHPVYRVVLERLQAGLEGVALLPGAGGAPLAPGAAVIVDEDALARVLAGVALTADGRQAVEPLDPRARAVARMLGARPWGAEELVALLERTLGGRADGLPPPAAFLAAGLPLLLGALGRAAPAVARLRELPLLPDGAGRLHRPAAITRADAALRALYGEGRPLLDATLDLAATPEQARLLELLGVARLRPEDLLAELADAAGARRVLRLGDGPAAQVAAARALYAWIDGLPPRLVGHLGALPLFLDEELTPRPLVGGTGGEPAFLAPHGALGELVAALDSGGAERRPPLLHPELAAAAAPLLRRLGAVTLDVATLVALLGRGAITLADGSLLRLHELIEETRADLTARQLAELAAAPLFPGRDGRRRALVGDDRALLPADDEVTALAPEAPWLDPRLRGLRWLRALGVEPVGARAVARTLLLEEMLFNAFDAERLRRAYGYLAARPGALPAADLAALAAGPVWLDETGERYPLAELRRAPADAPLAALYRAWGGFPLVEERAAGTSALELALALGLGAAIPAPGYALFARDVRARPLDPAGPLRPLLVRALCAAAGHLGPADLAALRRAPLFRDAQGAAQPLASWDEPGETGCATALEPLRGVLARGTRPLLHPDDQAELQPLLDALGLRPAGVLDLVAALEDDPALGSSEARAAARGALVARAAEVAALAARGRVAERLAALPLWPAQGSAGLLPASRLLRGADLERAYGAGWREVLPGSAATDVLAPSAEADAAALAAAVAFRDPVRLILGELRAGARPGRPLAEQPPVLRRIEHVLRVLGAVVAREGCTDEVVALPLGVDAAGRLRAMPCFAASDDERGLLAGLPLGEVVADPAWAAGAAALDARLAPPLALRRVAGALADATRAEVPVADAVAPPGLADPAQRARLYRWLLAHDAELAADVQALGLLRPAHLIPSAHGVLRAPGALVLQQDLPELDIDWHVAAEVPAELTRWIERTYELDEGRLQRLLELLLDAHDAAVAQRDGARAAQLLGVIARALRVPPASVGAAVERLPRRLHLRRRIFVECADGSFQRARTLLIPAPDHAALLAAFCQTPPPMAAARYDDPLVHALLSAVGAWSFLHEPALGALLRGEGLKPGLGAALALSRYVALATLADPSLRSALQLDRAAWIPDGRGARRSPAELYWPDDAVITLLGEDPGRHPHPELLHAVPAAIRDWLPFRRAQDVTLPELRARLDASGPAPAFVLDWLEEQLEQRRLDGEAVRAALGDLTFLVDDDGVPRPPGELFLADAAELFGGRRGVWRDGRGHPRLRSALRIP
ncbi:MAG TPA: ATP-binding protein, partial [Polyangia bacterium]